MNKTKIKKLKKHYLEMRQQIVQSLSKESDELDLDGDEIDAIQGFAIHEMAERLSSRDLAKLNMIDNALKVIDDGVIDECEDCGDSIGEKRLMVLPGVRTCVACAEQAENNSKMFA